MNNAVTFFILGVLMACNTHRNPIDKESITKEAEQVPDLEWKMEETFFDKEVSLWRFKVDSSEVSGLIVSSYPNGRIYKSIPVLNGERYGTRLTYFPDGKLKFMENFKNNKLNGPLKRWGIKEGYQLMAELHYENGRLHGEQKKWYASGELHKVMHIAHGKENGMQQAYRKNGALYANYEAKNGRVFGLKRTQLCFELNDEQPAYN